MTCRMVSVGGATGSAGQCVLPFYSFEKKETLKPMLNRFSA